MRTQELTEVKPLWVEKSIKLPYNIRRYNERGMRNYHTFLNNQVHYFPSVTSITKEVMPTNEGLIRWISEHGEKRAKEMAKEAANYGTLMHIAMSNFLLRGYFDFDTVDDLIESYILEERIRHSTYGWADRLKSDIKAFEVFVKEHKVKPKAIEIPLMSFRMRIAGTIDLVCEMTIGTGQNGAILKTDIKYDKEGNLVVDKTRRIIVIIDWKSGRNGFYPEHEVQLHLYKPIWEENFPNITIDSVYNWAPKDWESEPDYKLKCQDESIERFNITAYLQIFNTYNKSKRSKLHPIITGVAYLDQEIEPVHFETTEDHLLKRFYKSEYESEKGNTYSAKVTLGTNGMAIPTEIPKANPWIPLTEPEQPIIKEKDMDLVMAVRAKTNGKIHKANGEVVTKEPSDIADEVQDLVKGIFNTNEGEV